MAVKITEDKLEPSISFRAVSEDRWPELLMSKAIMVRQTVDMDARVLGWQSKDILESGAWKLTHTSFREFVEKEWHIEWELYQTLIRGLNKLGYESEVKREHAELLGRMLQAREAEAKGALAKNGGDRRSEGRDQANHISLKQHGTGVDYLLRRLLRDAPEFVSRYEKGEFPSVRQAAIAAGIVKVQTPEEKAVKAFRKAKDQQQVLRQILEELSADEAAEFEEPSPQQRCKDEAAVKAFDRCDNRLNVLHLIVQRLEKHERAVVAEWLAAEE